MFLGILTASNQPNALSGFTTVASASSYIVYFGKGLLAVRLKNRQVSDPENDIHSSCSCKFTIVFTRWLQLSARELPDCNSDPTLGLLFSRLIRLAGITALPGTGCSEPPRAVGSSCKGVMMSHDPQGSFVTDLNATAPSECWRCSASGPGPEPADGSAKGSSCTRNMRSWWQVEQVLSPQTRAFNQALMTEIMGGQ